MLKKWKRKIERRNTMRKKKRRNDQKKKKRKRMRKRKKLKKQSMHQRREMKLSLILRHQKWRMLLVMHGWMKIPDQTQREEVQTILVLSYSLECHQRGGDLCMRGCWEHSVQALRMRSRRGCWVECRLKRNGGSHTSLVRVL